MSTLKEALITNQLDMNNQPKPLSECVREAVNRYFAQLEGEAPINLYEMVLEEIEAPLLESVMHFTRGNQSKAARLLGLSRGTLRTKLRQYFDSRKPGKHEDL
jgi:Fis family transcriptional regulator, factor for inversion stimulation protein